MTDTIPQAPDIRPRTCDTCRYHNLASNCRCVEKRCEACRANPDNFLPAWEPRRG